MTTGERMKKCRKEYGVPVEVIAEALDVSIATVYRYESGDIEKLPGNLLEPLAQALHTTPSYLMGWEDFSSVDALKSISEWLKEARTKSEKSVSAVSKELSNHNIKKSSKTLYGYENGHSMPDIYTLLALCNIYGVEDILSDMGYKSGSEQKVISSQLDPPLSQQEIGNIEKYRELTGESQLAVLNMVSLLHSRECGEE